MAPTRQWGALGWAVRTAAVPLLAFLGLALPLLYVPQLGDFAYFLSPAELVPAYGTAWLLLLAACAPVWVLLVLGLTALQAIPGLSGAREALTRGALALSAAVILAALLYCALLWLQTFHVLDGLSFRQLFWPAILLGGLAGLTPPLRRLAARARALELTGLLVGALCALTLPLFAWGAPPSDAQRSNPALGTRPNILLLTMDALSAEHMSLYGANRPTTPELSAFAQQSTTFDHMYANANYTTPGVSSLLTGTDPWTHRALQLQSAPVAAARRASLPALLQRAGYRLGYVSTNAEAGAAKNGLGGYFEFAARDRIKDVELCRDGLSSLLRYACTVSSMPLFGELVTIAARLHGGRDATHYDPALAIEPALAWLRTLDRRAPVFLWVHLFPPHAPYVSPAPWLGLFDASPQARTLASTEPDWMWSMRSVSPAHTALLSARYDESVRYVDHYAGQFLRQALSLLGPDTVVVITADHGESFRHGYGSHTGPGLYDEIIHVPLIIHLPHQQQARRSEALVQQVDLAPTLARLAGVQAPASWVGHSLLGAWGYADALPDAPAFSMNFEQSVRFGRLRTGSVAVIEGSWKLIHYFGPLHYPQMPILHDELYDLANDPLERNDLSTREPDQVARLRALIDAQLARYGGPLGRAVR